jgi:DNA-binding SARP family transcriptional activator/predicted ATPase
MSGLRLEFLGPPRVEIDGAPVNINRHKAMALLAYLAVSGEAQPRDTLATLFWPESSQSLARNSLRRDLSILNKALGRGWLIIERESVGLRHPGIWLDVAYFRQRLAGCRTHGHPVEAVCSACLQPLTEAVTLYRDDFLAGFSLADCPGFDEWHFFQAEALRQELASALERLVHGYSIQGEYEAALPHARRRLALDPLHEPAHRQLMLLYARTGQQGAALRQYQLCVQTLQEDLGVAPAPETTAMYQQIRAATASKGAATSLPDKDADFPPTQSRPTNNLPVPTTPFVGRVEGLAEIARRLTDPACRLLTLTGPGGVGKTRLAIQAARTLVDDSFGPTTFTGGVYFVRLVSVGSPDGVIPAIANALGTSLSGDGAPQEQLLNFLHQKEMLLILDNFEHLLPPSPADGEKDKVDPDREAANSATLVADILSAEPGIKILVTSWEALNLQGEWVYPVAGMRYPLAAIVNGDTLLPDVERYSAVQLFAQSARRVRPDFSLSTEQACVLHICRLVEGLPLALELAAAWLKILSCAEVAREIEHSLDFLSTSLRNVPARHRSMRAVFEHSWQLLTQPEQHILRQLSTLRGDFSHEAAEQVTGASLPELVALVDKSLLRITPTGRYRMHELLRQFAAEKLEDSP